MVGGHDYEVGSDETLSRIFTRKQMREREGGEERRGEERRGESIGKEGSFHMGSSSPSRDDDTRLYCV
jgi:hypothetical protein